MRVAVPLLLAIVALFASATAIAQSSAPPRDAALAAAHFRIGLDEFRAGNFAQAATDFAAAYESTHDPSLLFNIGSARYEAGDLAGAEQALSEYLRQVPDAQNRGMVEGRLVVIRQRMPHDASAQPATSSASPASAAPTPASAQPAAAPPAEHHASGVPTGAIVLLVGGAVVLIASAITYGLSRSALSSCTETPSEWLCPTQATANDASLWSSLTTGGLVTGGVLLAAGIVWELVSVATGGHPASHARRGTSVFAWRSQSATLVGITAAF